MNRIYLGSTDNKYIQFLYNKFLKNEYILKNHKCDWCGEKQWTWEYDFDKINIQNVRDRKIDQILNG